MIGFSSLAEGYLRCDASGAGHISQEQLNQPITSDDHPFLRAHAMPPKLRAKPSKAPLSKSIKKR